MGSTSRASRGRRHRGRRGRGRFVAFGSGASLVLVFPEPSLSWLAYVVLVPLVLSVRAAATLREAAVRGWYGGAGLILGLHQWLLPSLLVFLPLVAVAVGALWAPWGAAGWALLRPPLTAGRAAMALAVLPSGWLLIEAARSWEALGGPWALLGTSQWQVGPVRLLAALGGVWLVSYLVITVNVAFALLVAPGSVDPWARGVAVAAVAALAFGVTGWWAMRPEPALQDPGLEGRDQATVRIAVVQPGIVRGPTARLDRGVQLTRSVAGDDVGLVVWAESSVGFDLEARPDIHQRLMRLSAVVGAPLLVNVDARRSAGGIYKSSILVGPRGAVARYDKRRLVPFGEYIPLRPLLAWAARLQAAAEDRGRGDRLTVMSVNGLRIGPLISFESTFPDMCRELVNTGADVVVYQTATATFQDSWAPEQLAAQVAMRAAESGRPVVNATLTGVSTAYDATGRRLGHPMNTDRSGVLVVELPLVSGRTPYAIVGDWVLAAALGIVVLTVLAHLPRRRTRPDRPHPSPTDVEHGRPAADDCALAKPDPPNQSRQTRAGLRQPRISVWRVQLGRLSGARATASAAVVPGRRRSPERG